jgi:hypothetical protein
VAVAWALVAASLVAAPPKPKPALRIPVWVNAGDTLAADKLKASIDGVGATITGMRAPGESMLVILVLDLVEDIALAEAVKQSLIDSVNSFGPNVWVAVMKAQDGLQVVSDPTPDHAAIQNAIRGVAVTGKAGLLETVETALTLGDSVSAKSGIRVAICFLTDSSVSNYREDFTNPVINSSDSRDISRTFPEGLIREKISKMEASIAPRQTPLFIVHDCYRSDRLNEAYQAGLMSLAVATGGSAVFCRSSAEIPPAVSKTLEQLRTFYSVTVQVPDKARRNLEVKLDGGGATLNYRGRFTLREK